MKKHLFISFLLFSFYSFSQKKEIGVFLSYSDYQENTLSFSNKGSKNYKLRIHPIFKTSFITIQKDKETFNHKKDSIYGYQKGEEAFRFYNQSEYKIVQSLNDFFIYSKLSFPKGKGSIQETHYFFSKETNSPIFKLTRMNLKTSFPKNSKFHDLLDQNFKNDSDLINFDEFYREYKLIRILKSIQ